MPRLAHSQTSEATLPSSDGKVTSDPEQLSVPMTSSLPRLTDSRIELLAALFTAATFLATVIPDDESPTVSVTGGRTVQ